MISKLVVTSILGEEKTLDIASLLIGLIINVIFWIIAVAPALWISGRLLAGKHNARFTDALWIVLIGTVVFYFFNYFVGSFFESGIIWTLLSYFILLVIWLALVKHFFDCGWLKALVISIIAIIIAVIIWVIILFILGLIGLSLSGLPNLM
jgi:hypothetical protein